MCKLCARVFISLWVCVSSCRATIVSATFDDFVREALLPHMDRLPVLRQEMGDTWIHGVQSDPQKTAQFRVGSAVFAQCVATGKCDLTDVVMQNFTMLWSKNMEHTCTFSNFEPVFEHIERCMHSPCCVDCSRHRGSRHQVLPQQLPRLHWPSSHQSHDHGPFSKHD